MKSYKDQIDKSRLPRHIAIVMDGNGRWAKAQGKERVFGHVEGVASVRTIVEAARTIGISYLTLYTFSTENFNRPEAEVSALMDLFIDAINRETDDLIKNDVKGLIIGDLDRLSPSVRAKADEFMQRTAHCQSLTLVLAISYSSRWEICQAAKNIALDVKAGKLDTNDIDEKVFSSYLTTADIPDPDLMIRTGGEYRISNYLLWQAAYSELYFCQTPWPAFKEEAFYQAIVDFQMRERRFGKTSEQIQHDAQ